MPNHVFVLGFPHDVGGAGQECWGAVQLWRSRGVEVTFIPLFPEAQACWKPWKERVEAAGCKVIPITPGGDIKGFKDIPGLDGSTIVSFCCHWFYYPDLVTIMRERGCRTIWVPTMCWSSAGENKTFADFGLPDAIIYQSKFQRHSYESLLIGGLAAHGFQGDPYDEVTSRGHLIRGAFDLENWPFAPQPHTLGKPFVIGKLAGPREEKWHPDLWSIYGKVPYEHKTALVMGLNQGIADLLGPLPSWAKWIPPRGVPTLKYYGMIDALVPLNRPGTLENFPRIGLESFALGIPVVAMREGGWVEQITDGETGLLADTEEHAAWLTAELIYRPKTRKKIVHQARNWIETELTAEKIWPGWGKVLKVENLVASMRESA